ncbi:cytochrome c peroxidase [Constrictibacter sp. MBR-5]|uniref:His-Xaa-Ser system-associated MauG-like protein n=1 Tax=Constrictibacter sp. MBR-5 TaxID=3156467 RepID=UPI003396FE0A
MNSAGSLRSTKSAIRAAGFAAALLLASASLAAPFEDIVRKAARDNGFAPAKTTHVSTDPALVAAGRILFESKSLSLNGQIACQTCHLTEFGSADGIPNAVAVGGEGKGTARIMTEGGILPRNTLPFWGRGGQGFNVFFWDGKIDFSAVVPISQFGDTVPSDDPLVTAVHLPPVEIREMLAEDDLVRANKREDIGSAQTLYRAIAAQVAERESEALANIAAARGKEPGDVEFGDIALALASFIRAEFRLRPTRFHKFVFSDGDLTDQELRGAQLFYGKGKCANCHSGPYMSDFGFHAIAMPQLGFGKNGFGIDYGRFNVTHDPEDLYKFRTPPLLNAEKTAPYGHSGSMATLEEAIVAHFDPLHQFDPASLTSLDRHEFFKRLAASADSGLLMGYLDDAEVEALVGFLKTLSF